MTDFVRVKDPDTGHEVTMSVEQAKTEGGKDVWAASGTLKREAIRLLGLLAMRDPVMQDRIRDLGGLEAVLSLTKLDEREPCSSLRSLGVYLARTYEGSHSGVRPAGRAVPGRE